MPKSLAQIFGAARIPHQLVLTAKKGSLEAFPAAVRRNVLKTLSLSPGYKLRLLGDAECQAFIREHYDKDLELIFEAEPRGSFRGDICRAAVLAKEGGFYLDLDVELKVSLSEFADPNTSFVSAYTQDEALLNAFMAAEPRSPVMLQAINEIRMWYNGQAPHRDMYTSSEWLGPVTMLRAIRAVARQECPGKAVHPQGILQWACGSQVFRMYEEQALFCWGAETEDCPRQRAESEFDGVRYGIYTPDWDWNKKKLVAWPRFAECTDWGCAAGGWDESPAATALPPLDNSEGKYSGGAKGSETHEDVAEGGFVRGLAAQSGQWQGAGGAARAQPREPVLLGDRRPPADNSVPVTAWEKKKPPRDPAFKVAKGNRDIIKKKEEHTEAYSKFTKMSEDLMQKLGTGVAPGSKDRNSTKQNHKVPAEPRRTLLQKLPPQDVPRPKIHEEAKEDAFVA